MPLFRLLSVLAVLGIGALIAQIPSVVAGEGRGAPATVAPPQCVCSAGLNLAEPGQAPSILRSCQCGSLQCVVHVGSGHLQCR